MGTFTRNVLGRGLKLTWQAAYALLQSIGAAQSAAAIDTDNVKQKYGTFRVNLIFPCIDYKFCANGSSPEKSAAALPFALPPLQDFLADVDMVTPGDPHPEFPPIQLTEVSFSCDTRREPAGISADYAGGHDCMIDHDVGQNYRVRIMLSQKTPTLATGTNYYVDSTLFNAEIDPLAFTTERLRTNPWVLTGLNSDVDPYKSLVLEMVFPDFADAPAAKMGMIVSAVLSLRFRYPLGIRDDAPATTGALDVQNMPTVHRGVKVPPVVTVTPPGAGTILRADGDSGLATLLRVLDQTLLNRLDGGYRKESDLPVSETLAEDACYDVIAVPLWQNVGKNLCLTAANAADAPYAGEWLPLPGGAPYKAPTCHRQFVPLHYPMTIHHVLFSANYGCGDAVPGVPEVPVSATWSMVVGVGIGRGLRGDEYGLQPIASLTITQATRTNWLMDRVKYSRNPNTWISCNDWDSELFQVPLVDNGDQGRSPWVDTRVQGKPFFVGKATNKTAPRTGAGGNFPPWTEGQEQWLEVRCEIKDTAGLSDVFTVPPGGAAEPGTCYAGQAGHWCFIIGKKHLCEGPGDDLPL